MFVDRAVLNDLVRPEDGPRSLATAVRELVDISAGRRMFARVERTEATWHQSSQDCPPPTLPILALSVLAASEMSREGAIASHNYYVRLAKAMIPDASDAEVAALRHELRDRNAFTAVADMWARLDRWLKENDGRHGYSTILDHAELTRIGYPLSQTLVRKSDRAALTRFFDRGNLAVQGMPSATSLIKMLKVWTSTRSHGLSDRFVASLGDPSLAEYMKSLVYQLAQAWDGKTVTVDGLRRLDLRIVIDLDRANAWWVIPAVRDVSEDTLCGIADGREFAAALSADPHSSMFDVEGLPSVSTTTLSEGMEARGTNCAAKFRPATMLILRDNADAGGWMSVDALQPYEEHALVVASTSTAAVERALKDAADSGWRRMDQSIADKIFSNYAIFYCVTFSDREALEAAMGVLPTAVASNFRVGSNIRPRLVNGLPILRDVARNVYLSGGEPDLALPVGAVPRKTIVSIDGITDRLSASIFPFPISRVESWREGPHHVKADGEELTFVVAPGNADDRDPPGMGSLSWSGDILGSSSTPQSVSGAFCSNTQPERPALARRGATESWLILPSGQMIRIDEPPQPIGFDGINFPLFEVDNPRATWLAQKRREKWSVTRIRVQEPNFHALSSRDRQLWRELCQMTEVDDAIWQMYRTAWGRFNES